MVGFAVSDGLVSVVWAYLKIIFLLVNLVLF